MNLLCAESLPGAENLNVQKCLARLDQWTEHVRCETERHLYRFRANPKEFDSSRSAAIASRKRAAFRRQSPATPRPSAWHPVPGRTAFC
jgi:hypothetical protein